MIKSNQLEYYFNDLRFDVMNNKKNMDDNSTDVDIKLDKKDKGLWKKVTGIWDTNKKSQIPPAKLPSLPSDKEKTSRTISSNHTLHGKIKSQDLGEKGHNFDTTEVEMGKLGLHSVSRGGVDEKNVNYSNVDNATLTGIKIDMRKPSLWDEMTRTKLNVFSALKKMKNREEDTSENKIQASNNTKVHNPEGTVLMAIPKTSNWRQVAKILAGFILIGGLLMGVFYGISYWSSKKDQVQVDAGEKNETSSDKQATDVTKAPTVKEVTEAVNFQVAGRGLIYNCKGKHWACVDKTNYLRCRDLAKTGSKECMVKGVLKTTDACFAMQRKYISNNMKTDFCQ
jgi:hypothetical protein